MNWITLILPIKQENIFQLIIKIFNYFHGEMNAEMAGSISMFQYPMLQKKFLVSFAWQPTEIKSSQISTQT